MSSLKYWIWLSSAFGVGCVTALKLLEHFKTPENIYYAGIYEYNEIPGLKRADISQLVAKDLTLANKIVANCEEIDCRIMTIQDSDYPRRLINIYDPPIVLYIRGSMPHIDSEAAVAVVGTRKCTPYGIRTAEQLGYTLAERGLLVVTGLAKGVDTAAARGALRGGGEVVGVIGSGVDVIYPSENISLFEDVSQSGAIVSEYPPGTPPVKPNFPARNRIISGLSLGVAVLESPQKSGALITAARALEQSRDVFSMPGNVDAVSCAGSNSLLREGAIPILSAEDIISEYTDLFPDKIVRLETLQNEEESCLEHEKNDDNYFKTQQRIVKNHKLPDENFIDNMSIVEYIDVEKILSFLSGDEKTVAKIIGTDTVHVDDIIVKSGLSTSEVLTALTMLELSGAAEKSIGNSFRLIQCRQCAHSGL